MIITRLSQLEHIDLSAEQITEIINQDEDEDVLEYIARRKDLKQCHIDMLMQHEDVHSTLINNLSIPIKNILNIISNSRSKEFLCVHAFERDDLPEEVVRYLFEHYSTDWVCCTIAKSKSYIPVNILDMLIARLSNINTNLLSNLSERKNLPAHIIRALWGYNDKYGYLLRALALQANLPQYIQEEMSVNTVDFFLRKNLLKRQSLSKRTIKNLIFSENENLKKEAFDFIFDAQKTVSDQ